MRSTAAPHVHQLLGLHIIACYAVEGPLQGKPKQHKRLWLDCLPPPRRATVSQLTAIAHVSLQNVHACQLDPS